MNDVAPLRILIIEDDVDTRANLQDILELDDHVTQTAGTIREALSSQHWSQLDVLILDRKLPDGTAEDLLYQLKKLAPQAAIVIVTGFADVEGAITALRRGASDYILKPINPDALRTSLNRIAEAKRAEKELKKRSIQQELVADIGYLALQSADLSQLLNETAARVAQSLDVGFSKILEVLPDERGLLLKAGVGWKPGLIGQLIVESGGHSQAGYTLLSGTSVIVDDMNREPRFSESSLFQEHGIVSGLSVVIHGDKHPFGVLGAYSTEPRAFTKSDIDFLQSLANVLAAAIQRMKTEERALKSERLAAIGQMVTGLAHESRNALQRSQACLEMLELELENQPEALVLVSRIQKAQQHLHHLYEEVRGYAVPINLKRRMCNLRTLWLDTWAHLEIAWQGKNVELIEQLDDIDLHCEVDEYALGQVFRNILENAISACTQSERSPTGQITIQCTETELDMHPALHILFHDNGPGISQEQMSRIFEPFYTTKTQGTGLGMAIAKRIVEAHGGRIRIDQASPQGADVSIILLK